MCHKKILNYLSVFVFLFSFNLLADDDPLKESIEERNSKKIAEIEKAEDVIMPKGAVHKGVERQAPDFTQEFKAHDLQRPVFLNIDESDYEKAVRNLLKPVKSSVVVTGENGVGKSAFVDTIAYRISNGDVPKLNGYRVLFLESGNLSAGSEHPGVLEKKIQGMVDFSRENKVVWVIDEIHSLRGQGTHSNNSNDVFQWLKPYLTQGILKIIGMSTHDEFKEAFGGDPALADRFREVKLTEPTGLELVERVKSWTKTYYDAEIDDKFIERAISYSNEYNAIGNQPRKAIDLITEVFSILDFKDIPRSEINIYWLTEGVKSLWDVGDFYFDHEEKRKKLNRLPTVVSYKILGQDAAIKTLIDQTEYSFYNINKKDRPKIGVMNLGPKGTGKTESVYALAEALELPLVRILMSDYSTPGPGSVEDLKKRIYQALNKNAFSILFFDEFEKAPIEIQNSLLDILDKGRFVVRLSMDTSNTSKKSIKVDVRKASIVMASNAGADYIMRSTGPQKSGIGFSPEVNETKFSMTEFVQHARADGLSPYVLDRLKPAVYFPIEKGSFQKILGNEIDAMLDQIEKENKVRIKVYQTDRTELLDYMVEMYYRPTISIRMIDTIF
ncbi:AAA family ATPase, partial [bacterium]|nr:AAA family ATPase [bacterium]